MFIMHHLQCFYSMSEIVKFVILSTRNVVIHMLVDRNQYRYLAVGCLVLLGLASLFVGALNMSLLQLLAGNTNAWHTLMYSRLPRVIAVILTGISLSIAGLIMQKLSQNRFVSPSTAVTMDGARLGILVAFIVLSNQSLWSISIFALLFAAVSTVLFMTAVSKLKIKNIVFVPLLGIMIGMIIDSITTFLALKFDLLQVLSGYMTGSFTPILQGKYELLFISIPLIIIAVHYVHRFSIVAMGEDFAHNIGMNYKRVMLLGILIVATLSASVIVTIGSIPFVGLIVPNVIAYRFGDGHQDMLLDTALLGANLLLVCDLIARLVIYPYEVPVSLVLGIIGSAYFLFILLRGNYET